MKNLIIFLMFISLASCNGGGGGDDESINTNSGETSNQENPSDEGSPENESESGSTGEEDEGSGTTSEGPTSEEGSTEGGSGEGESSGSEEATSETPSVEEYHDNLSSIVNIDGSAVPVLFNYQEFPANGKTVSISVQCSDCSKVVVNKSEIFGDIDFYPPAKENLFSDTTNQVGDDDIEYTSGPVTIGENNFTVTGYDDNGDIKYINYFKIDMGTAYVEPQGVSCTAADLDNHEISRLNEEARGRCFGEGTYNGVGMIEENEATLHVVYFAPDTENVGKESVVYEIIDLKNNQDHTVLHVPNNTNVESLHTVQMKVESNLELGAQTESNPFRDFPSPSLIRSESGDIFVSFASGTTKSLNIYSFNSMAQMWMPEGISSLNDIEKVKFIKKIEGVTKYDVLYVLKDDGSFYEFIYEFMSWSSTQITFSNPAFSPKDFDVDFNNNETKFVFTDGDRDLYQGIINSSDDKKIDILEISTCGSGTNEIDVATSRYNYDPLIRISDDGEAYILSKAKDSELLTGTSNEWTTTNMGSEGSVETIFCKEDLSSPNTSASGFYGYEHMYHNTNGNYIGVDSDLVLFERDGQTVFYANGKSRTRSAITGTTPYDSYEWTNEEGVYLLPWINGEMQLDGFSESQYNLGHMQLLKGKTTELLSLFQFLKLDNSTVAESPDVSVCYLVPDIDSDGVNAFKENYYGLNDLDEEDEDLDSDNDGLQDYFEIFLGLNPTITDSDNDGENDSVEAINICTD